MFSTEFPYKKSSTLSIGTMLFKPMRVFEHDPFDACGLHGGQAKQKDHSLMYLISKYLYSHNAEGSRSAKIRKDVRGFTTLAVSGKQNRTPAHIFVCVKKPVRSDMFRVPNQIRKGPSPSQLPTAARLLRSKTKLMQTAMERKKAEEVQSKTVNALLARCSSLRNGLGVFDNPFASELPLSYSIG